MRGEGRDAPVRRMSRKWARISISLLAVGLLLTFIGVLAGSYIPVAPGFALLAAAVWVKLTKLRCPYCTAFQTTPQWFGNGNKKCRKCKQFIQYDY